MMKFLTIPLVAYLQLTYANDMGRKINQAKDMLAIIRGIDERDAKQLMRGYGCYCYPLDGTRVGPLNGYHGEPLDELDKLCKHLYRAERCLQIDSANGEYPKDCHNDMAYPFYEDSNNPGNVICGEEGIVPDPKRKECKIDMCELERDFVTRVNQLFNSGYTKNSMYDDMNAMDYDNVCVNNNGGGHDNELACCGAGIERRTYNSLVHQCCNDQISAFGDC